MSEPAKHIPECDGNGAVLCWSCAGSCGGCACGDDTIDHETALDCDNWEACEICHGDGSIRCPACAEAFGATHETPPASLTPI